MPPSLGRRQHQRLLVLAGHMRIGVARESLQAGGCQAVVGTGIGVERLVGNDRHEGVSGQRRASAEACFAVRGSLLRWLVAVNPQQHENLAAGTSRWQGVKRWHEVLVGPHSHAMYRWASTRSRQLPATRTLTGQRSRLVIRQLHALRRHSHFAQAQMRREETMPTVRLHQLPQGRCRRQRRTDLRPSRPSARS